MPKRPHLSLVTIVQDEAASLRAFLRAARGLADEIVLVDGGSLDDTVAIAREFPEVRLFERTFDDFALQKNFALDQARGRWILHLDADEALGGRACRLLRTLTRVPGMRWYKLDTCYVVREQGAPRRLVSPEHGPDYHVRLFRNVPVFRYDPTRGRVHESFPRKGRGWGCRLPGLHIFNFGYERTSLEERRDKVARYDSLAPEKHGTHLAYLWEERDDVRLVACPERCPEEFLVDL